MRLIQYQFCLGSPETLEHHNSGLYVCNNFVIKKTLGYILQKNKRHTKTTDHYFYVPPAGKEHIKERSSKK